MGTQSHRPCVQTLSLFGTTAILALISCILAEDACSTRYPPICLDLQNCTNVDAWGLQIGIGNPGRVTQSVCMSPSTVISATYVIGKDICQDEVCRAGRGGTFDEEAVDGGFATRNEPALDGPEESLWGSLNSDVDTFGNIGFSMGGFVQLNNYEIGVVTNGTKFNLGHLGLGPHSTLLQSMKDQGLIDRLMFGFDAGSQSYSNPRPGHLVLGGIDRSRVLENFVEFDIDYGQEGSTEFRPCPFKVNIKKMDIVFSDRTRPFIDPEAGGPEACIEPYDMLFRFQPGRLLSLESEGLDGWISSDDLPNLKVNEPGWVFPAGKVEKFSLDISLGNGFQISIPTEEIQHPLRGINPNGTWETMRNYTELNIFQEAAVRNTMVFGKAFLSRVRTHTRTPQPPCSDALMSIRRGEERKHQND